MTESSNWGPSSPNLGKFELGNVVNSDSNFTPIQTMMCGAKENSNKYQSKHKQ